MVTESKQKSRRAAVNSPDLSEVMQLIGKVTSRVGLHRTRTGSDTGLTSLQLSVLTTIFRRGELTMGELARASMTAQSAASRLVAELARKKLVKRVRDRKDRRVLRVTLTVNGQKITEQARTEAFMLMSRVLAKMTPQEVTTLTSGLKSLLGAVETVEQEVFLACSRVECRNLVEKVDAKTK